LWSDEFRKDYGKLEDEVEVYAAVMNFETEPEVVERTGLPRKFILLTDGPDERPAEVLHAMLHELGHLHCEAIKCRCDRKRLSEVHAERYVLWRAIALDDVDLLRHVLLQHDYGPLGGRADVSKAVKRLPEWKTAVRRTSPSHRDK
jgi:hypothetical protein